MNKNEILLNMQNDIIVFSCHDARLKARPSRMRVM